MNAHLAHSSPPSTPDDSAGLARGLAEHAASLGDIEYDLSREQMAANAGIRISTLDSERAKVRAAQKKDESKLPGAPVLFDEVSQWPECVDCADLLNELCTFFHRFAVMTGAAAIACALWATATYCADAVDCAPILAITSPDKRCGKSTVLDMLARLVLRPLPVSNITGAALFRVIEKAAPTLLIDEGDSFLTGNDDLRGIVNSGHTRATAFILRTVGDDFEPRRFSTWGFKAIACIGKLPATIADRAIEIGMRRRGPTEVCSKLRDADPADFDVVRRKLMRFVADSHSTVRNSRPAIPDALNDRAADSWSPLIAIADLAGGSWGEQVRQAALTLSQDAAAKDDSVPVLLLSDIREILDKHDADRIAGRGLVEALTADPEKLWATFNHGKAISQRQVATRLRAFGVVSRSIRIGNDTPKGYLVADFADAFTRYLPSRSATTTQTNNDEASGESAKCNSVSVLHIDNSSQPNNSGVCDDVALTEASTESEEVLL